MNLYRLTSCLAALTLYSACSTDESVPVDVGEKWDLRESVQLIEQACDLRAKSRCERWFECKELTFVWDYEPFGGDVSTCVEMLRVAPCPLETAFERDTATIDFVAVEACISSESVSCDQPSFDECLVDAVVGASPRGARCFDDVECADGLPCVPVERADYSCGYTHSECGVPSRGEACLGRCAEGLFCDDDDVCRPVSGLGDGCERYGCSTGNFCDESSDPPTCAPLREIGESCDPADPEVRPCARGHCHPTRRECVDFVDSGQPCESDDICSIGVTCLQPTVCPSIARLGGECGDAAICVGDTVCRNGLCEWRYRTTVGDSCEAHPDCRFLRTTCVEGRCEHEGKGRWSDVCIDGRCREARDRGEPCSQLGDCRGYWLTCHEGQCRFDWELPICQ